MRLFGMVCLAVALSAGTVSAQGAAESSPSPTVDVGLRIPMIVWASGVTADQITTYRFLSEHRDVLHEQNPLIHGLDRHPLLLVATGSAIDAATAWASYRFLGRRHPRLAKIAFYGAAAYRTYLAFYNLQMIQRAERMTASSAVARVTP